MNLALAFNDNQRYWSPGSYVLHEVVKDDSINVVSHSRIPEDFGVIEASCGLDIDLVLIIDDGQIFKTHHSRGKLLEKTKVGYWISDLHRSDWAAPRLQAIKDWHYDHIFYAQKNFKQMILDCGYQQHEISFLPHAADPEIFKPMSQIQKRVDAGFVGYLNDKRIRYIDVIKQYVNFKHYVSVWAYAAARSMAEMKICINIPVENDVCNMRTFESAMAGIPMLIQMNEKNGIDDHFKDDMYMPFTDENDLKEKLVRLIASKDLRDSMAKRARTHALQFHTYKHRINTFFSTMGFPTLKD